ncbi:MAG: hypothetical protein IT375_08405 [Polyangiaceae bacterium]|nr:hypothetical protein [Polyangiaceae bacterium]MCK6531734.1 hypothetical protein [Polyangiaceae bacterium]
MKTTKLLKKAISITALPLLLALATTSGGCLGHAGPSEVAQGQRYQSGDATYDQFFENVHELSIQMSSAPKTESQLRMALAKELGVEPEVEEEAATPAPAPTPSAPATPEAPSATDAYKAQLEQSAINAVPGGAAVNSILAQVKQVKQSVGQFQAAGAAATPAQEAPTPATAKKKEPKAPSAPLIAKAVKERSEKLGFEMKLTVERGESTKTKMLTRGDNADGDKLARWVEKTAKGEAEVVADMQAAKKKLAKLASIGAALEANADAAFKKSRAKASEVKKNLADARALIELMESRADEVGKKASLMVDKLETVASASIEEPAPAAPAPEPAKPAKPAAKQADAAKAKEPAKALAKEPAKARPRGSAPKTALADFEP